MYPHSLVVDHQQPLLHFMAMIKIYYYKWLCSSQPSRTHVQPQTSDLMDVTVGSMAVEYGFIYFDDVVIMEHDGMEQYECISFDSN